MAWMVVFFPLFQRGIEGDFQDINNVNVAKSPLAPL
jgi:hypothetical protein